MSSLRLALKASEVDGESGPSPPTPTPRQSRGSKKSIVAESKAAPRGEEAARTPTGPKAKGKRGRPKKTAAPVECGEVEGPTRRPSRACKTKTARASEAAGDAGALASQKEELRRLVEKHGGDGGVVGAWRVEARTRPSDGRREFVFVDAAGKRHRSKNDAARSLGLALPKKAPPSELERAPPPKRAAKTRDGGEKHGDPPSAPPPAKRPRTKNVDVDLGAFGWTPPEAPLDFGGMLARLKAIDVPKTMARANIMPESEEKDGIRSACVGVVAARSHGILASDFARRRPGLTRELVRFGVAHLPKGFKFTSIQLNHNFASELHVDDFNSGSSYIVGLGSYKGGALWTLEHGPLECKHTFVNYDGTEPHATLPFTGDRYTLIFFSHQTHPKLKDEDREYLLGLGFPLPSPTQNLRNRVGRFGFSSGKNLSYEAPKRVKTAAGRAAFDAHLSGASIDEARAAGDRFYEAWRAEDAREATPEQRAIQGKVFSDEGTRWKVRDPEHRGVYYDCDLKRLCVEYYDYDAYGDDDPGSGEDFVDFTPYDELMSFAEWLDDASQLDDDDRAAAKAECARRLDAKKAFEAADDAMDYLDELDKKQAVDAVNAARTAAKAAKLAAK